MSRKLMAKYPELPDGLERLAEICEVRGDFSSAANNYRKAAELIHGDENYDSEVEQYYRQKAVSMDQKAKS